MTPTKAFEEMVEKQLAADREAALTETKSVTKVNAIIFCVVLVGIVGYRTVTWLFFGQAFSIQDFEWAAAVMVLMVIISRFFAALDWTVRDKRLIRTELRVKELLEIHQVQVSQSRLANIEKRMGRLEQLINVVLTKQEKTTLDIERRIGLSLDRIRYSVDQVREDLQAEWFDEAGEQNRRNADFEEIKSRLKTIEKFDRDKGYDNAADKPPMSDQPGIEPDDLD